MNSTAPEPTPTEPAGALGYPTPPAGHTDHGAPVAGLDRATSAPRNTGPTPPSMALTRPAAPAAGEAAPGGEPITVAGEGEADENGGTVGDGGADPDAAPSRAAQWRWAITMLLIAVAASGLLIWNGATHPTDPAAAAVNTCESLVADRLHATNPVDFSNESHEHTGATWTVRATVATQTGAGGQFTCTVLDTDQGWVLQSLTGPK